MRNPLFLSVVAALGLMVGSRQSAAQAQDAPIITQLMTPQQQRAAGLQKLTPSELRALNDWLVAYSRALAQLGAAGSSGTAAVSLDTPKSAIESAIDGEFTGWEGETIFKLRNGQIWQQSSYAYTYHYAYAPKVIIYPTGSLWKMQVDGVSGTIYVHRIK